VTEVLPGYVIDRGINNVNNMGAAMAPAAADTLYRYFKEGDSPDSFDMIITGDLGREGSSILAELLNTEGIDIATRHVDCGNIIYNADSADKHAGGSGCGCSAVVTAGYLLYEMRAGRLKNILFLGTGALMSPMSVQQGQSIPGIAHLVRITTA
jgi:stage V sporulation protein AD